MRLHLRHLMNVLCEESKQPHDRFLSPSLYNQQVVHKFFPCSPVQQAQQDMGHIF